MGSTQLPHGLTLETCVHLSLTLVRSQKEVKAVDEWDVRAMLAKSLNKAGYTIKSQEDDIEMTKRTSGRGGLTRDDVVAVASIRIWGDEALGASLRSKLHGIEVQVGGSRLRCEASIDEGITMADMKKKWEKAYGLGSVGYKKELPGERPDTLLVRNVPSRWLSEPAVSSNASLIVTHTVFSTFGEIRNLEMFGEGHTPRAEFPAQPPAGGSGPASGANPRGAAAAAVVAAAGAPLTSKLSCDVCVQYSKHEEFKAAATAFVGHVLRKEGAPLVVRPACDVELGGYFSAKNTAQRIKARERRAEEERRRAEREKRQKEADERRAEAKRKEEEERRRKEEEARLLEEERLRKEEAARLQREREERLKREEEERARLAQELRRQREEAAERERKEEEERRARAAEEEARRAARREEELRQLKRALEAERDERSRRMGEESRGREGGREGDRGRDRDRDRDRDRARERDVGRERDRERDREREKERERERDRGRDRDVERGRDRERDGDRGRGYGKDGGVERDKDKGVDKAEKDKTADRGPAKRARSSSSGGSDSGDSGSSMSSGSSGSISGDDEAERVKEDKRPRSEKGAGGEAEHAREVGREWRAKDGERDHGRGGEGGRGYLRAREFDQGREAQRGRDMDPGRGLERGREARDADRPARERRYDRGGERDWDRDRDRGMDRASPGARDAFSDRWPMEVHESQAMLAMVGGLARAGASAASPDGEEDRIGRKRLCSVVIGAQMIEAR